MAKIRGKNWYQIVAPKFLKSRVLGESPALELEDLMGRVVETSVMDLTGDPGKYYLKLFFMVNSVDGGKAATKFVGHESTRDFLARIVQVRTSRIDTNEVVPIKDMSMRVKSVIICNRHVGRVIAKSMRMATSKLVAEKIGSMSVDDFVNALIDGNMQKEIQLELKKIYPVRVFEIRATEVL